MKNVILNYHFGRYIMCKTMCYKSIILIPRTNTYICSQRYWEGTASLEAKLLQKLESVREEVLCAIFMDLHEVYDDLDWYIYLEIL